VNDLSNLGNSQSTHDVSYTSCYRRTGIPKSLHEISNASWKFQFRVDVESFRVSSTFWRNL